MDDVPFRIPGILNQRSKGEMMRHILDHLLQSLHRGESAILGTIVRSSGSAPRTSGARMLVKHDGTLVGSIGGGAVEGTCQARTGKMFKHNEQFALLDFKPTDVSAVQAGMVCGGAVSVLLVNVGPQSLPLFTKLSEAYRTNKPALLLTALPQNDSPPLLHCISGEEDSGLPAGLRDEVLKKFRQTPFLIDFDNRHYYIEPLVHPGTVYLVGAGHVALATATCAAFAGFEIVVMDDRTEYATTERYPQARDVRVLASFDNCLTQLGPDDYVVIATRSHHHDRDVLAQALRTSAGYVGMIGSRKKRVAIYRSLQDMGFTETELQRAHCPIGLAIGAATPEEIAISIVAELIEARSGTNI